MFHVLRKFNHLKAFRALPAGAALLALATSFVPAYGQQAKEQEDRPVSLAILSIIPSQAEPGMIVTLYGSGFTDSTRAFLGNLESQTSVDGPKQLSFAIPDLAPGLYGLYLKREDGATSKVYRFSVTPRTPHISSISPDSILSCAAADEREAQIIGTNFQQGSQVLFDGAVIRSRFASSDTLLISVPQVPGGLHNIQVKNPGGTVSSPVALFIDSKPEITSVTQGDEFVNYYNLIIDGRNFQSNSTVVVEGKSMTPAAVNWADREKVVFVDCNRIIYQRHPYDTAVKSFDVQVINPSGEASSVVQVSAP
jgi:hypothetical protein